MVLHRLHMVFIYILLNILFSLLHGSINYLSFLVHFTSVPFMIFSQQAILVSTDIVQGAWNLHDTPFFFLQVVVCCWVFILLPIHSLHGIFAHLEGKCYVLIHIFIKSWTISHVNWNMHMLEFCSILEFSSVIKLQNLTNSMHQVLAWHCTVTCPNQEKGGLVGWWKVCPKVNLPGLISPVPNAK